MGRYSAAAARTGSAVPQMECLARTAFLIFITDYEQSEPVQMKGKLVQLHPRACRGRGGGTDLGPSRNLPPAEHALRRIPRVIGRGVHVETEERLIPVPRPPAPRQDIGSRLRLCTPAPHECFTVDVGVRTRDEALRRPQPDRPDGLQRQFPRGYEHDRDLHQEFKPLHIMDSDRPFAARFWLVGLKR
jgi:hypothetical protein